MSSTAAPPPVILFTTVPRPAAGNHVGLADAARLLAINKYLLNGRQTNGQPADYILYEPQGEGSAARNSPNFATLHLSPTYRAQTKGSYIMECVRSSLKIAELQLFADGNHRTATLALFEALAAVNILLEVRPFEIYVRICNSKKLPATSSRQYYPVRSWSLTPTIVADADREIWAEACKEIAVYRETLVKKEKEIKDITANAKLSLADAVAARRKIWLEFKKNNIAAMDYKSLGLAVPDL
ncbi:hypothetical protein K438DRAFT_1751132 [Mycena galopus ATCC 62051]|nr:hypothetical protein K438DRAFT_1751132 [Mycena galopus ATCC 62051]